ncbi:hypothetical protein [Aquimarina hainanensis]|uniref:hypothetical protein n=1 Tax=Aquimarina hainanensis TaxID=1578017 RepID=UPI00361E7E56
MNVITLNFLKEFNTVFIRKMMPLYTKRHHTIGVLNKTLTFRFLIIKNEYQNACSISFF